MKDYRQLAVWQRSHQFTLSVYQTSRFFPSDERFGIASQLRRASSAIPANLAEGCGRDSDADFKRFVVIAHGSASESEYILLLASELGMFGADDHAMLGSEIAQIKRMLGALVRKLKADS
ncbi:MAG: diversity-rating retroelement protein bAvd family protein [Verrucomicrobia bacterium]|nr:diversity-rating retroelement protein bAvd family protein [Verrucomicrobiota bacterium]